MPILNEVLDKVRTTHMLVRSAGDWNKLAGKVTHAWENGDDHHRESARNFHLIAWASVARNLLADPFEGVGITTIRATTAWGIATLTTGKRSCEPQLVEPQTGEKADDMPRLRDFDAVMAEYEACLNYLAGTTGPGPRNVH